MELINVIYTLWRRRLLVLAALLVAVALAVVIDFRVSFSPPALKSRQYAVGVSVVHVLVDTPHSTIADLDPSGADVLGQRANLLANLTAASPVAADIAQGAGIRIDQLAITPPSLGPVLPTVLAERASASGSAPAPYHLSVTVDASLPIISMRAEAPDPGGASRLAASGVAALSKYLGAVASQDQVPPDQRPVISPLGNPVTGVALRGPRRLYGLAAALVVFAMLCTALVVTGGVRRRWREARALESATSVAKRTETAPATHEEPARAVQEESALAVQEQSAPAEAAAPDPAPPAAESNASASESDSPASEREDRPAEPLSGARSGGFRGVLSRVRAQAASVPARRPSAALPREP